MKILLVEDDRNLSDSLMGYLEGEGFWVDAASSLLEARVKLRNMPDLIVLDWMLPDGQGIDYLKELVRDWPSIPVLLLTARADLVDKVVGLETGACDYLTKPFEPRELCARIRVQFRKIDKALRSGKLDTKLEFLEFSGIRMILESREVTFRGSHVPLTKMEFELLRALLEAPHRVFPREALLNRVWGYESYPTTRTVDNHIVQLRQKFDPNLFETVRGVGYRLQRTN